MRIILITCLLFIFSCSLIAQAPNISISSSLSNASIRESIKLTSDVSIDGVGGADLRGASIESILTLRLNDSGGNDIEFNADLDNDKLVITITPSTVLLNDQIYFIQLGSVEKENPAVGDTLEMSTYTFTTGSAPTVAIDTTSNICIGDPAGLELNNIVITENLADNFFSTSNGQEHQLILEVDAGFEFISEGSISLESETDIGEHSIEIVSGNARQLLIKYKLCTGSPCLPSSANEDKITIRNLAVRTTATNSPVAGTMYEIKRIDSDSDNAVIPALEEGTVFARLQVAESPPLVLTNLNTDTEITGTALSICPGGQLALSATSEELTELPTFYIKGKDATAFTAITEGVEDNQLLLSRSQIIEAIFGTTDDKTNEDIFPFSISAEILNPDGVCRALSEIITVNLIDTSALDTDFSGDLFDIASNIIPNNQIFDVEVVDNGGILRIFKSENGGQESNEVSLSDYNNQSPFQLNINELASPTESVTLRVVYARVANNTNCEGPPVQRIIRISPIPNVEQEIGIKPAFCDNGLGESILIEFTPNDFNDSLTYSQLSVLGQGITQTDGSISWNAKTQEATGYSFNPDAVFPSEDSVVLSFNYKIEGSVTTTRNILECYQELICDDFPQPCPFDIDCELQRDIDRPIGSCRYVQRCSTRVETIIETFDENIEKKYVIRYSPSVPLTFTNVTRDSLKSVYCVNSGPVLLLGLPGNTFNGKSYRIKSNEDANFDRNLGDYSFVPGYDEDAGEIPPNTEGYTLYYSYTDPSTTCISVDSFQIQVVDVPEVPVLSQSTLPEFQSLPILKRYCIGELQDSIRLTYSQDSTTRFLWRDDRGFLLDSGNSFLPEVNVNESGLTRFSVESQNVQGGCSGEAQEFYIQIGEQPEANYSFMSQCANAASFTALDSHSGNLSQGDSIQNIYFNYNDSEASEFMAVAGQTHQFTFPSPGVYNVEMAVQTSIGCTDTFSRKVTVFDQANLQSVNGKSVYVEDFKAGSNGWISTADNNNAAPAARNSSWNIREVNGQTAWHAYNESTGTYNDNEFSWVQSPYINLENWRSPKLQMDILFDTPELEGAVVQYQLIDCQNPENNSVWTTLGEPELGLNWYNNGSISAGPGGSINGWSGTSQRENVEAGNANIEAAWQTVAYDLGSVKAEANGNLVQFRVAFASLSLGANREPNRLGFAFTNLSIAEKNRNSLIEHFTSIYVDDPEREEIVDFAYSREDVVYLQYHTIFPTPDPLHYGYHFKLNSSNDHLLRGFKYGFDKPIYTIMNGRFDFRDPFFAGEWGEKQYSKESLLSAAFELEAGFSYEEGKPLQVRVNATRTSIPIPLLDTAQGGMLLTLKAAIVERAITGYTEDTLRNVLVKYLPNHAGAYRKSEWEAGETLELQEEWMIPVEAAPERFGIVTWIETGTRAEYNQYGDQMVETLQVIELPIDIALQPAQILSNKQTMKGNWVIYPVPAQENIQVQRQETINAAIEWRIISTTGALVKEGSYSGGTNAVNIDVSGLNAGIYMLQMNSSEGQLQRKFVKE